MRDEATILIQSCRVLGLMLSPGWVKTISHNVLHCHKPHDLIFYATVVTHLAHIFRLLGSDG